MAGFGGLILTNKGRALQAKAQAGATLHYNRVGIGDGNLGGQSIPNLNNLISQKKSLPITKLQTLTGGKAVVGTVLTNQDVTTGFYFRELGVFAQDPDEGEILFCYGNAGANAEFIPPAGGQDIIEKTIDAVTIVGNTTNVTATIDNSLVFATKAELLTHLADPGAHGIDLIKADIVVVQDDLSAAPATPVTIPQGVSIVNADRKSRFKDMQIKGRTIINDMGRVGNFETGVNGWSSAGTGAVAANTTDASIGTRSCDYSASTSGTGNNISFALNLVDNGVYFVSFYAKHINGSSGLHCELWGGVGAINVTTTSQWQRFGTVMTASSAGNLKALFFWLNGSGGQVRLDGISVCKLPSADQSLAVAELLEMYPYVDDMKHVNAVYATNPGKNLHTAFTENAVHANAVVTDVYSLTLNATAATQVTAIDIAVLPNQTYTFSLTRNGTVAVSERDKDNVLIQNTYLETADSNGLVTKTITTTANTRILRFNYYNTAATGTFTFTNPMLNIGSKALPFEPSQPSYMYLPDCNLRSNVDGSIADRLYMDGEGKPRAVRRFREIDLVDIGVYGFAESFTGYKAVATPAFSNIAQREGMVIKYDGKPIKALNNVSESWTSAADKAAVHSDNKVYITVANSDSGWGDAYTPSEDEMKAYFNGWKISSTNTASPAPYTGTGNRYWYAVGSTPLDSTWYTAANDINWAVNNPVISVSRYKLMYQLAQSIDEPVTYEGELMLHDGANQIEAGTGVVVREAAKPYKGNDNTWRINSTVMGGNPNLKNRVTKILDVYVDENTGSWNIGSGSGDYGKQSAYISDANYDPTAAYSVTYFALDTYKLGIAPQSINGAVTPNIKETVDDAVQAITGLRRDVSVLQNTKAQKRQPQWIDLVLLNDWSPFTPNAEWARPQYKITEDGFVQFRGIVYNGIITKGTVLAIMPRVARAEKSQRFVVSVSHDASDSTLSDGHLYIDSTGNLKISYLASNWFVDLSMIRYEGVRR